MCTYYADNNKQNKETTRSTDIKKCSQFLAVQNQITVDNRPGEITLRLHVSLTHVMRVYTKSQVMLFYVIVHRMRQIK